MTDVDSFPPDLAGMRQPLRTVLVSVPDARRRDELSTELIRSGFRVLGSSSWTAALDLLAENSVDLGIVDAAITDYYTDPPSHPRPDPVAGSQCPTGEVPLIFLVDDPGEFDWDAYALLDRAEVHAVAGTDRQLVRRVCALANRLDRQALERQSADRLRTAVRRVSASIQATNDPVMTTERLVAGLVEVFGVDIISFTTFDDDRVPGLALHWKRDELLHAVDTTAYRAHQRALSERLWSAGTTLALSDHRGHTPTPGMEDLLAWAIDELGAEASISVPIGDGDTAFGLLWMASGRTRTWSPLEISLLQHLAGNVAHGMMQGQVITAQQEVLRRLERLARAKNDFLATVNHELRTPLTSLTAYLDLVQDGAGGPVPDQAAQMLSVVARNAKRLGALIDDVLTVSRMAADDPLVDWAPVDLSDVTDRVLAKLAAAATAADVDLVASIARDVVVEGDAAHLGQVVFQLLGNAIKFTRPGGRVEIEVAEDSAAGEPAATIAITDTGIGIPEDEMPELFTSFFRGSNAQAGAVAGSGLGLVIVRGLVEAHQGRVTVEPAETGGTRVCVQLPTHRVDRQVIDRLLRTD